MENTLSMLPKVFSSSERVLLLLLEETLDPSQTTLRPSAKLKLFCFDEIMCKLYHTGKTNRSAYIRW